MGSKSTEIGISLCILLSHLLTDSHLVVVLINIAFDIVKVHTHLVGILFKTLNAAFFINILGFQQTNNQINANLRIYLKKAWLNFIIVTEN